jgi:curved DNA-binding protein CbpA
MLGALIVWIALGFDADCAKTIAGISEWDLKKQVEEMKVVSDLELFGLKEKFTTEELRESYKRLALRYHPDRRADLTAAHQGLFHQAIVLINNAHDRLQEGGPQPAQRVRPAAETLSREEKLALQQTYRDFFARLDLSKSVSETLRSIDDLGIQQRGPAYDVFRAVRSDFVLKSWGDLMLGVKTYDEAESLYLLRLRVEGQRSQISDLSLVVGSDSMKPARGLIAMRYQLAETAHHLNQTFWIERSMEIPDELQFDEWMETTEFHRWIKNHPERARIKREMFEDFIKARSDAGFLSRIDKKVLDYLLDGAQEIPFERSLDLTYQKAVVYPSSEKVDYMMARVLRDRILTDSRSRNQAIEVLGIGFVERGVPDWKPSNLDRLRAVFVNSKLSKQRAVIRTREEAIRHFEKDFGMDESDYFRVITSADKNFKEMTDEEFRAHKQEVSTLLAINREIPQDLYARVGHFGAPLRYPAVEIKYQSVLALMRSSGLSTLSARDQLSQAGWSLAEINTIVTLLQKNGVTMKVESPLNRQLPQSPLGGR